MRENTDEFRNKAWKLAFSKTCNAEIEELKMERNTIFSKHTITVFSFKNGDVKHFCMINLEEDQELWQEAMSREIETQKKTLARIKKGEIFAEDKSFLEEQYRSRFRLESDQLPGRPSKIIPFMVSEDLKLSHDNFYKAFLRITSRRDLLDGGKEAARKLGEPED